MGELSCGEERQQLSNQVSKQATEQEAFLIRACWEASLCFSYANDKSFSDAVHGYYPLQQKIQ